MRPIDAAIEELDLVVYAKDQPEYVPLPARVDSHGTAVTCWRLTWRERLQMLWRGQFYLTILTFKHPLQPIRLQMDRPSAEPCER